MCPTIISTTWMRWVKEIALFTSTSEDNCIQHRVSSEIFLIRTASSVARLLTQIKEEIMSLFCHTLPSSLTVVSWMLLASAVSQLPCSSHERPPQLFTMRRVIGRVALHQMAKWCSIRSLKRRRSFGCLSLASKYPTSWTKTRTWLTSAVTSPVWRRIDASQTLLKAQSRANRLFRRVIARQASSPNS